MTSANPPSIRLRSLEDYDTLRALAWNLGEGIYITDARGKILDANPAFLELLGVKSVRDLEGYCTIDLVADPARQALEMRLLERDGLVREFELEIVRPDGERRTVLDTMYVCRDHESGETFYHGVVIDITQRKQLENQLREMCVRDALTGCYNRRYLFELGEKLMTTPGATWACIYIDIDHFKQYNDQFGHQNGDRILVRMSRFLMQNVRAEEPVVRVGGDEFLIVLTGDGAARVEDVATRLQTAGLTSAPAAFSLGHAERLAGERFDRTVDRADQHLIAVRVVARTGEWPVVERRGKGKKK